MTNEHPFLSKKFQGLFWTQFFGAFNDNFYKNAMIVYLTYILAAKIGTSTEIYVTAAAGVFIVPFFLFSASAGILADTLEKSALIRNIKLAEIIIMSIGTVGFYLDSLAVLMFVLFMMAVQSAIFGPLKYSLLPFLLKDSHLVKANGIINTGTFISILLGIIGGSYFIVEDNGVIITGICLIAFAVIGFLTSFMIPKIGNSTKVHADVFNIFKQTVFVYKLGTQNIQIKQTIYGVSWFWFIGASIISQLPNMVSTNLNADNLVYIFLLGFFAFGIGFGAFICSKCIPLPTVRFVPLCFGLLTLLMVLCYPAYLIIPAIGNSPDKISLLEYISMPYNYPLIILLFLTATVGGIYIIPQFSLTQKLSKPEERSQVIAANNILNSLLMVISAIFIILLNIFSLSIPLIFALVGLLNIPFYFLWKKIV